MNDRLHFALFDLHAKSALVASTPSVMQYHASRPIRILYIEAIASNRTPALLRAYCTQHDMLLSYLPHYTKRFCRCYVKLSYISLLVLIRTRK